MSFRDRAEAGRRLAERLAPYGEQRPLVVGLPRGGVPVAAEVAIALDAPLDVLVVRKLGVPWHPELGFGAVGEGGVSLLNRSIVEAMGLSEVEIQDVVTREDAELLRRVRRYRGSRPAMHVEGRVVIVVDDGIATGFTAKAAIQILRRRRARCVVLAAPVAPPECIAELRRWADEVVVLETPQSFQAVGQFYDEFPEIPDEDVTRLLAPRGTTSRPASSSNDPARTCDIDLGPVRLSGELVVPSRPLGIVVFAHGSGSSRHSPRNRSVARRINQGRMGTLLFDLLTPEEELDRSNVFDIPSLAARLVGTTRWLVAQPEARGLPIGYFGASTGAAAALWAAADLGRGISSVVSRGGRPDLAAPRLADVRAPTLLIVGGRDKEVEQLNRRARELLVCETALEIVPGATHLFEEPGALDRVAGLAEAWFSRHFTSSGRAADPPLVMTRRSS